jgi:hypothetical protein
MIKIIKKLNIFKKGPVQYRRHKSSGSGFVILFAVTISSILLAIALGVADIALKEVKFGTSAKDTGNAFFAADTAVECALFNDKPPTSLFPIDGPAVGITCGSNTFTPTFSSNSGVGTYTFSVVGLGSAGVSCAKIVMIKDPVSGTSIDSKGYDIGDGSCNSSNPDRIEREIITTY